MNCQKCGNNLNPNEEFCSNCGEKVNRNNTVNTTTENNTKKSNKIIVIVAFIVVFVIATLLGIFIGKKLEKDDCNELLNKCENSKTENNNVNNNNDKDDEDEEDDNDILNQKYTYKLYNTKMPKEANSTNDLTKNIEIYSIFFNPENTSGKYARAYIYGKNKNNVPVSLNLFVDYYDSENYRIDEDSVYDLSVKANSEFVAEISASDDSLNYKTSKLLYSASNFKSYNIDIDNKDIKVEDTLVEDYSGKDIDITLKNNSKLSIKSGTIACIYYKNKNIVFATDAYVSKIDAGKAGKSTCYGHQLALDENYKSYIEYDDYKVVLFSAYGYDDNY